jgi:hypothetical protein
MSKDQEELNKSCEAAQGLAQAFAGRRPPDAAVPRGVERVGNIVCRPILDGLHHQYGRM